MKEREDPAKNEFNENKVRGDENSVFSFQ